MNPNERIKWETRLLGAASVATVAVLIGASVVRVWRLGKLPDSHGDEQLRLSWRNPRSVGER